MSKPALRRHSKSNCPVLESGCLPCSWGMRVGGGGVGGGEGQWLQKTGALLDTEFAYYR